MNTPKTLSLALATACIVASLAPGALATGKPKNERPVIVQTGGGAFDWGDAAIGAAAGFGAAVAAAGGITLARNR